MLQIKPTRVVIGGVNGTGKSTFTCSLYVALKMEGISVGLHELDVYSDTHAPLLGLKPWEERKRYKSRTYEGAIRPAIDRFEADEHAIVLGDLPGKLANPWLEEMIAGAELAILVGRERVERDETAKHPQSAGDWEKFYHERGTPVICRVQSMLSGQEAWEGTISAGGLDRTLVPMHPAVQDVVRILVATHNKRILHSAKSA